MRHRWAGQVLKNFDIRQAARDQEVEALRQATRTEPWAWVLSFHENLYVDPYGNMMTHNGFP